MADYGRFDGSDMGERSRNAGDRRDRGWGESLFGSSRDDDDWDRGRRAETGWGSGGRANEDSGRHHRDDEDGWRRTHAGRERGRDDSHDRSRSRSGGYGSDDGRDGLAIDETSRLIGSNKVEGTAVYGRDGARMGSIYNFMVDKYTGRVDYAVMTTGGFLGMGTRYFPLPWAILRYDVRQRGYRIDMTERDLERAPSFDRSSEPSFDRRYGEKVHDWYGLNY